MAFGLSLARRPTAALRGYAASGGPRRIVELGNALNQLGVVAAHRGRIEEALRYHREALSVRRGHDTRGCAESFHSIGYVYEAGGRRRESLANYARAVRCFESIRRHIGSGEQSRVSFQQINRGEYLDAARLSCALGRGNLAFRMLQRGQNRTLLDGLVRAASGAAASRSGGPAANRIGPVGPASPLGAQ